MIPKVNIRKVNFQESQHPKVNFRKSQLSKKSTSKSQLSKKSTSKSQLSKRSTSKSQLSKKSTSNRVYIGCRMDGWVRLGFNRVYITSFVIHPKSIQRSNRVYIDFQMMDGWIGQVRNQKCNGNEVRLGFFKKYGFGYRWIPSPSPPFDISDGGLMSIFTRQCKFRRNFIPHGRPSPKGAPCRCDTRFPIFPPPGALKPPVALRGRTFIANWGCGRAKKNIFF